MKSHSVTISKILKNYNLCEYCTGRLISKLVGKPSSKSLGKKYLIKYKKTSTTKCYICKNLFDDIDSYIELLLHKSSNHQFNTFVLGTIIKPSFSERDDLIKSKFKIRAVDSLKTSITTVSYTHLTLPTKA